MASVMGTENGIRRTVRLRQMLRNWRNKAQSDVPAGRVAIYAAGREGNCSKRFVISAMCLNHPVFAKLLSEAEEEYGFSQNGPLKISCDESVFEDVIRVRVRFYSGDRLREGRGGVPAVAHWAGLEIVEPNRE